MIAGKFVAPWVGFEPTTTRLTAEGSAVELPRNQPRLCAQESIIPKQEKLARTIFQNSKTLRKRMRT